MADIPLNFDLDTFLPKLADSIYRPVHLDHDDLVGGQLAALHVATVALDTQRDTETDLLSTLGPMAVEMAPDMNQLMGFVLGSGMLIRNLAQKLAAELEMTPEAILQEYASMVASDRDQDSPPLA